MDECDNYGYGYSSVEERFYDLKSGRRQGRINMIAGYRDAQLIAPFTIEGACNRSMFEIWLETCLIPELQPGEWVIVDNATFHQGGRIAQLIEEAGCKLVYLPPYSPDLNRIEKCWAWLKVAFANSCATQIIYVMRWKPFSSKQRPNLSGYSYSNRFRQRGLAIAAVYEIESG